MKKSIYFFCLLLGGISCNQENILMEKEVAVKPAPILPADTLSPSPSQPTDTLQVKDWNTIIVEGNILQNKQ